MLNHIFNILKTKVEIRRKKYPIDMFRSYTILANSKKIGSINANENLFFEISEETDFQLKIDWCYSNVIKINPIKDGNNIILLAKSNLVGLRVFIYFIYITFKRKKYLNLEKIN